MMPSSATSSAAAIAQRYVFAGMAICVTMTAGTLWMPALLGALSQGYGLGTRALSHLAFAEVLGFLLGTLFTSAKTVRELKQWVLIGCALVIGANVILLLFAPAVPFMALRPIAGLGAGLGYGYVLKVCSASARPTRSFGLFTASTSIFMILGFQVVAYLIETRATINGVADADSVKSVAKIIFGIYATFAAAAAVILLTNQPPSAVQPGQVQPQARGALSASVLICLLAVVLIVCISAIVYFAMQASKVQAFVQPVQITEDGKMVLVLEAAEEGGYTVTAPFIQGLVTEAETLEEAFEMARDAAAALKASRAKLSRPAAVGGK